MKDFQKQYEVQAFMQNTKFIQQFWKDIADLSFMQFALEQMYLSIETLMLKYDFNPKTKMLTLTLYQIKDQQEVELYKETVSFKDLPQIVETKLAKLLDFVNILQIEYQKNDSVDFKVLMEALTI